jgi:hypothetical protein
MVITLKESLALLSKNPGPSASVTTVSSFPNPSTEPISYERSQCPSIKFYTLKAWAEYTREANRNVAKYHCIEDINGVPVGKERMALMSKVAFRIYGELFYWGLDPHTYAKILPAARRYIVLELQQHFEEFKYCEGGYWKVDKFCTGKYPDWCTSHRDSGKLLRKSKACSLCISV